LLLRLLLETPTTQS